LPAVVSLFAGVGTMRGPLDGGKYVWGSLNCRDIL
jgi:hypothetical protein